MTPASLFHYNQLWGQMILEQLEPDELGRLSCANKELSLLCRELPLWENFLERDFAYYEKDFGGVLIEFERLKCIAVNRMHYQVINFVKKEIVPKLHFFSCMIPEQVTLGSGADKFYQLYAKTCRELLDLPHVRSFDQHSAAPEISFDQLYSYRHAYNRNIPVFYLTCIDSSGAVESDLDALRQSYRILSLFRKWVPKTENLQLCLDPKAMATINSEKNRTADLVKEFQFNLNHAIRPPKLIRV